MMQAMKSNVLKGAVLFALLAAGSSPASAIVLTFDDLVGNQPVYDGYGGFDWDNDNGLIYYLDGTNYGPSGYQNGTVSPNNVVYHAFGDSPSSIDWAGTGTFDFVGAYWTSAWYNQQLTFTGYNNNSLLYTSVSYNNNSLLYTSVSYAINTQTPTWIGLNWTGIDRLQIANTNYQWAMDNFTFNEGGSSVPEPASLALLGLGLAGLGWMRRKSSADA